MICRRFSYGLLAQLKFILPEVIEIKKILIHDEKNSSMKPDLHVTLNIDAIKNEGKPNASGNSHMRKVFHARILDFFKAHPKVYMIYMLNILIGTLEINLLHLFRYLLMSIVLNSFDTALDGHSGGVL